MSLLDIFALATDEELEAGRGWYVGAHVEALSLAATYEIPLKKACGVLAVLSPSQSWNINVVAAHKCLLAWQKGDENPPHGPYYPNNGRKAFSLLSQAVKPPFEGILHGPKVEAFYECIFNPLTTERVCVDGHAICAYLGERKPIHSHFGGEHGAIQRSRSRMAEVEGVYRDCALSLGLRPCQFQAVVWLVWRRLYGITR